jgi:cytochrome P450
MRAYFGRLWNERVNAAAEERPDLDDGAQRGHPRHGPDGVPRQLILLIVGGNDTTRNTMSGASAGAEPEPGPVRKLRANPG